MAASYGLHALLDMPVDVLHHDDGIVDHQADGQHQRQQRQQIDRIAERQQHEHHADQRQRNGDDGNDGRAQVAQKQKDHHDHDQPGLDQRGLHLLDGRFDELGRVIGDRRLHARRQLALDIGERIAHLGDDGQRVGRRRGEHADEHRLLARRTPRRNRRFPARARCSAMSSRRTSASPRVATTSLPNAAGLSSKRLRIDAGLDEVALHLARRR